DHRGLGRRERPCLAATGTRTARSRRLDRAELRHAKAASVLGPAARRSALRKNRRLVSAEGWLRSGQMKIDPPSPSLRRAKQFFAELKRHNVCEVAVAHALVA